MIPCRRNRSLALVLAGAALLLPAARASAQGTSGLLPNPISGRDLDAWSSQLGLSSEQRRALEPMHEQYLDQYRQLRDNEIQKYLENVGSMMGGMWGRGGGRPAPGPGGGGGRGMGMGMGLDRAAVESSLNDLDKLMTSIRTLDD